MFRFNWSEAKHAALYLRGRPPYQKVVIPWLLEYYHRKHPTSVGSKIPLAIDVACGNGQLTSELAGSFDRVIGVDISEAMLKSARIHNAHPNVAYKLGLAEKLSEVCAGETPDVITLGMGMAFVDADEFYSNVKKMLKPCGVLAIFGYMTPGVQLAGFETLLIDYMIDQLSGIESVLSLKRFYSDVYVPFEGEERRTTRIIVPTNREGIRIRLLSSAKAFKDGEEGVEKLIQRLPAEGSLEMICDIFSIITHT